MIRLRPRTPLWLTPCLAALACLLCSGCGGAPSRPNVVLLVIDTLRADRLGTYGWPRQTSPRLDRLAEEGAVFLDVNAQSSWTRPSMVSLFSGRYITAYRDLPFEEAPTLAELFSKAGYRTYGAISNVLLSAEYGFDRGFDNYDERRNSESRRFHEMGRPAPALVADLLQTLEEDRSNGPCLIYAHFMDPHHPYEEHEDLAMVLPIEGGPRLPGERMKAYAVAAGSKAFEGSELAEASLIIDRERSLYDREVRSVDRAIEDFLNGLEELGLMENTVVAVVSDHGEALYEQIVPRERWGLTRQMDKLGPQRVLMRAHGLLLAQSLVATPFLLWGRGVPAQRRVEEPVQNVDLLPTLLELCDVAPPDVLHGKSLVPWLQDKAPAEAPHPYVFSFTQQNRMVRESSSGWKLTLPNPPFDQHEHYAPQLMHLPSDPEERDNRFADEPEIAQRLTAELERWMREHPIATNADRKPSRAEIQALRALGYIESDSEDLPGMERK